MSAMPAGLHIVAKRTPGKPVLWYVYAWRGGPQIARKEGGARPAITGGLTDAAAALRSVRPEASDTIAGLIERYTDASSPAWTKLSASTRTDYGTWHSRIAEEFGSTPLKVFHDRRIRADVLDWRDRWADKPRSADAAITAFSALLTWAFDRGMVPSNVLFGTERLYENDRSEVIWEPQHFAAFGQAASIEVREAVELAELTGIRRGDLVRIPFTAVGDHAIIWKTSKSRGRATIRVPLLPETRALLARIKARHAAEMAAKRPSKRKALPDTILSNSYWRPWTPKGLGSRFNDAKIASGIDVNFHDLRGTFATRCMIAGLTDQEIADILGWTTKDVAAIREKYVSQSRVVISIGERISAGRAG
jgi:integrase